MTRENFVVLVTPAILGLLVVEGEMKNKEKLHYEGEMINSLAKLISESDLFLSLIKPMLIKLAELAEKCCSWSEKQ